MPNSSRSPAGTFAAVAAASRTLCGCGGPPIVAAVGVALAGVLIGSLWLVTVGTLVGCLAAGHALRCHSRRGRGLAGPDGCCANTTIRPDPPEERRR